MRLRGEKLPDAFVNGLGCGGGVDDFHAGWLCAGDFEITLANFFEEGLRLAFDAVEFASGLMDALPGGGAVHVEHKGQMRQRSADGESIDGADTFKRQAAGDALIDGGGVEEAIEYDKRAGFEERADFFPNDLCTTGGKEEQFAFRSHAVTFFGMLEEMTDALADLGAAGFAQNLDATT